MPSLLSQTPPLPSRAEPPRRLPPCSQVAATASPSRTRRRRASHGELRRRPHQEPVTSASSPSSSRVVASASASRWNPDHARRVLTAWSPRRAGAPRPPRAPASPPQELPRPLCDTDRDAFATPLKPVASPSRSHPPSPSSSIRVLAEQQPNRGDVLAVVCPEPVIPDAPVCLCIEPRHRADRGSELAAVTTLPAIRDVASCTGSQAERRRQAPPSPSRSFAKHRRAELIQSRVAMPPLPC